MGNIMICGSLCDSCDVTNNNKDKDKDERSDNMKINIDELLIKEIHAREKMEKMIKKEVTILQNYVDSSFMNLKEITSREKELLRSQLKSETELVKSQLDIEKVFIKEQTSKQINIFEDKFNKVENDIEGIKSNHLHHIESDINVLKNRNDNTAGDIKEIKDTLREINKNVIKNSTKLELL